MRALLVGDSMVKYLNQYLPDDSLGFELDIVSFPGATIESLTSKISVLKNNYDWVLVHVGTNNAALESATTLLQKYRALTDELLLCNPNAKLIFSGVIPRSFNRFISNYQEQELSLKCLNGKIEAINKALKKLCFDQEAFVFCSSSEISGYSYLGRDGLHLNWRGNQLLFNHLCGSLKDHIASEKIKNVKLFAFDPLEFPPLKCTAVSALSQQASHVSFARPVQGAATPVSRPVQGAATPVSRPVQGAASPVSRPVEGAASPVSRPVEGAATPVSRLNQGIARPSSMQALAPAEL